MFQQHAKFSIKSANFYVGLCCLALMTFINYDTCFSINDDYWCSLWPFYSYQILCKVLFVFVILCFRILTLSSFAGFRFTKVHFGIVHTPRLGFRCDILSNGNPSIDRRQNTESEAGARFFHSWNLSESFYHHPCFHDCIRIPY